MFPRKPDSCSEEPGPGRAADAKRQVGTVPGRCRMRSDRREDKPVPAEGAVVAAA